MAPQLRGPGPPKRRLTTYRLPRFRDAAKLPQGPREYRQPVRPRVLGGPGDPPPGFVGATTSKSEWIIYWALARIFGVPQYPRMLPYEGGWPWWGYQIPVAGGRGAKGGAVIDFLINMPGEKVGLRIVTEYWHLYSGRRKQIDDVQQLFMLNRVMRLVDVYERDYIGDPTGASAIITCKRALATMGTSDPIWAGTVRRNRPVR